MNGFDIPLGPFWNLSGLILSLLIEVGMQFDASSTVTVTRQDQSTLTISYTTASPVE